MSKSKKSKKLLRVGLVALALVLFWFALIPYRQARAYELAKQAEQTYPTDPARAIALLKEANFIHSDPDRQLELASWQFAIGDPSSALDSLQKAKESDEYWLVKGKAELETGNATEAAQSLAKSNSADAKTIKGFIPLISIAQDHRVISANQLVKFRMLRTAERVLEGAQSLNDSGVALLVEIRFVLPETGSDKLKDNQVRLQKALTENPASIRLHELARRNYEKLGNQKAASDEAAKLEILKSGRI